MTEPDSKPPAAPALEDREIRAVFTGVMLIMFLGAVDQTIVGPALPTIGNALGGFNLLSWVVTIYLLSATAVTPLVGKLTDIYGRRSVIAASVLTFMAASIGAALAPNIGVLIVMRGIQGLGGGGLISLGQTVIGDVVSARERGKYQAYISGMFAVAGLSGPLMGGVFAEYFSWRLIFWINVPLSLIALYFCDRVLRRLPSRRGKHRLDYSGAALLGISTIALLLMMTWGGHEFAWRSPVIFLCLGITAVFGVLFVLRERVATEPLVPLSLLMNPVVRGTAVGGFTVMMTNIVLSIYVPIFFELYERQSASRSGALLLGLVMGTVLGSYMSGRYMRAAGHYQMLPRVGLGLATVGLATVAIGIGYLPLLAIVAILSIVGLGMGLCFPVLTVATQNAVDPKILGVATATHTFFRMLGGTVGVSAFGALIIALLPAGAATHTSLTDIAAHAAAAGAIDSLALSFRAFFGGCALVILFTWWFMWGLPEIPLRQHATGTAPAPK